MHLAAQCYKPPPAAVPTAPYKIRCLADFFEGEIGEGDMLTADPAAPLEWRKLAVVYFADAPKPELVRVHCGCPDLRFDRDAVAPDDGRLLPPYADRTPAFLLTTCGGSFGRVDWKDIRAIHAVTHRLPWLGDTECNA